MEKSKTENIENKDTNKALNKTTENTNTKIAKIMNKIYEYNKIRKNNENNKINKKSKDIKHIYEIARSLSREFRSYLLYKKKNKKCYLEDNFCDKYLYNKYNSYSNDVIQDFFSKKGVSKLYEEFLADKDYENNLEGRNKKFIEFKQKIINDEKNGDYSYKICRKNFHKIYSEDYNVNDLELKE